MTVLDRNILIEATGGDQELIGEILAVFFGNAPDYLDALDQAETAQDWQAHAHKIKGAARGLGAGELAKAAAEIEYAMPEVPRARQEAVARLRQMLLSLNQTACEAFALNLS